MIKVVLDSSSGIPQLRQVNLHTNNKPCIWTFSASEYCFIFSFFFLSWPPLFVQLSQPSHIWILTDAVSLMRDVASFRVSCMESSFWLHHVASYIERFVTAFVACTGLGNLKVLNLGFNDITDGCLVHLRGTSFPFVQFKRLKFFFSRNLYQCYWYKRCICEISYISGWPCVEVIRVCLMLSFSFDWELSYFCSLLFKSCT